MAKTGLRVMVVAIALVSSCGGGGSSSPGDILTETVPSGDVAAGKDLVTPDVLDAKPADAVDTVSPLPDQVEPEVVEWCVTGERKCINSSALAECQGGSWVVVAFCPEETHQCLSSMCIELEPCMPGTLGECFSLTQIGRCNDEGTAFEPVNCPNGEKCIQDKCIDAVCIPGQSNCLDAQTKQSCLDDGTGWAEPTLCTSGFTCIGGKCLSECLSDPKYNNSYIGCEYWTVDLDNYHDMALMGSAHPDEVPHGVVLANPGDAMGPATVTFTAIMTDIVLDIPDQVILPGDVAVVELPRMDIDGGGIFDRSVRIKSNRPIVAYQFNPLDFHAAYSDDSSLLIPAEMLGTEYLILSYPTTPIEAMPIMSMPSQHGYFTVVAVEEGETHVKVEVTARADTITGETDVDFLMPGTEYEFTLTQYQVLNVQADGTKLTPIGDLSGSKVSADRRIAVFAGHEEAVVAAPNAGDCCCAEHLEEQLFPVDTWDVKYHCVKARTRGGADADLWRVQAGEDGVVLTTIPAIAGLNNQTLAKKGDWVEAFAAGSFIVEGSGPIQVGQYLSSGTCTDMGIGDPALIMQVSASQYRDNYIFAVPHDYGKDYITVIRPEGVDVWLDAMLLPDSGFQLLGDNLYEYGWFEVGDGPHEIHSDESFGLYQYGFEGPASYGNPGGLNLIKYEEE